MQRDDSRSSTAHNGALLRWLASYLSRRHRFSSGFRRPPLGQGEVIQTLLSRGVSGMRGRGRTAASGRCCRPARWPSGPGRRRRSARRGPGGRRMRCTRPPTPIDKARRALSRGRRRRRSSARGRAARRDLRSRLADGVAIRELELLSWIISTMRGYSRGKRLRAVSSGARAGVNTPHLSGAASASAARRHARIVSVVMIISARRSRTCGSAIASLASAIRAAKPRTNSLFATFFTAT